MTSKPLVVHDNRIPANPADNVRLPRARSAKGGKAGVVDDPNQFLTPTQTAVLVASTPWPYSVLVHVAAWAGLRAGELAGLQVGDVALAAASLNVERTVQRGTKTYDSTKTDASCRRVPLMPQTVDLLRDYLRDHPRADDPTAPLFPAFRLRPASGPRRQRRHGSAPEHWRDVADRQQTALAAPSTPEHTARLVLDWDKPLQHLAFYKAVFRPAVLRAGLSPTLRFHSLRHTYVSLCVAAGIPPLEISRFVGHSKVTTTLNIYAHLFEDDHSGSMAALSGLAAQPAATAATANVIPLRRR